jgi:hypothetical protein
MAILTISAIFTSFYAWINKLKRRLCIHKMQNLYHFSFKIFVKKYRMLRMTGWNSKIGMCTISYKA